MDYKYPRTPHVLWSQGATSDDKFMSLETLKGFYGKRVIVTEKLDGECTGMTSTLVHARSLDSRDHPSRHWVKQFWGSIRNDIPENMHIFGENMYALHSIFYDELLSYFYGFSIWNNQNVALSWDDTVEWFKLLGITPVPVLYDGIYDEAKIQSLWTEEQRNRMEGYVVRMADPIPFGQFHQMVGKFVRKGHVQTNSHWMFAEIVPNRLKDPINGLLGGH